MKLTFTSLTLFALLLLLMASCKDDDDMADTQPPIGNVDCTTVKFSTTILPLINASCGAASCHGAGSPIFELTNFDQVKVFADNGKLKSEVLDTRDMPRNATLTSNQLGQVKCWLDDGAMDN